MKFGNVKIRPTVLVIAIGLVVALIYAVSLGKFEMVATLSVALTGAMTKLVESEEVSANGKE